MTRAVDLLSRREHSRVEMERKLGRHVESPDDEEELRRVLDALQAEQLLSDSRFAASLVRQRAPRYGDRRLQHDLRQRGVSQVDAEAALATPIEPELERARAVWARRFDALPATRDERGRQGRFLQARGFSLDTIHRVLSGCD